jgi:hypothetical protein
MHITYNHVHNNYEFKFTSLEGCNVCEVYLTGTKQYRVCISTGILIEILCNSPRAGLHNSAVGGSQYVKRITASGPSLICSNQGVMEGGMVMVVVVCGKLGGILNLHYTV